MTTAIEVKERPILMSGAMVRAILAGQKTQTRRTRGLEKINAEPSMWTMPEVCMTAYGKFGAVFYRVGCNSVCGTAHCPYGKPGDRLWVRESYAIGAEDQSELYKADDWQWLSGSTPFRWTPSIHMPRWASRLTLEIVSVRVERVADISEADARAEGCCGWDDATTSERRRFRTDARSCFRNLWDSINAGRGYSWESNPWVWCIAFKRIDPA